LIRAVVAAALVAIAGQCQSLKASLHRLAANVYQHELSPGGYLLQADLPAERSIPWALRRWAVKGDWRTLLERALVPASSHLAGLYVACLQSERFVVPTPHAGNQWLAEVVEGWRGALSLASSARKCLFAGLLGPG
jgi:hypothetical protein